MNHDKKMSEPAADDSLLFADDHSIKVDGSLQARVNSPLAPDALKAIINNHNIPILQTTVDQYDSHTIAHTLNSLDEAELLFFFKAVKSDSSAPVFTFLDQETKEKVIEAFSSAELERIVTSMSTDNVVDFVDELPANLVNKVLKNASPEDREQIYSYLRFKKNTAGTLMTPEYLSMKDTDTVQATVAMIRQTGKSLETVWEIFVTDNSRRLVGTIRLDQLLEADPSDVLKSIMDHDFVSVVRDTQEDVVIRAFRKYDISVLPITDSNQRMLGIITFDDVFDAVRAQDTIDVQLSAGIVPSHTPYLKTSILKLVKSYAVWIIILLALNTFTSMVLSYVDAPLEVVPLLTAFLPAVMGTNGNASDQTATVTVRELALGNITPRNYLKAAFKETKASLITAGILSVFSFGWILIELYSGMIRMTNADVLYLNSYYGGNQTVLFLSVAGLVSLTFLVVVVIAKWLGVSLPVLAKLCHIDPAVMSQPLISNILDIVSICFYFLFASLIIHGL
jgi:magnesium transporter